MLAHSEVRRPVFRTALILLALANLLALAARIWHAGAHADSNSISDPAISLAFYIVLALWIGSTRAEADRGWLLQAATLGVSGGVALICVVGIASLPMPEGFTLHYKLQAVLICAAVAMWGIAAARIARAGRKLGFAVVAAIWSAMVSSLLACSALLAETYAKMGSDNVLDPWGPLQQRLMGPDSTQPLVHTLNAATGFLLIGPVVGCAAGVVFGSLFRRRNG
ncbi:MAG: hypothetical protein ACLGSD_17460 [Acidobacteriota bacterium]